MNAVLTRLLSLAIAITGYFVFGFFVIAAIQMHFDFPFADHLDSYNIALDFVQNRLSAEVFFAPHNEHRPYIPRLITILSSIFFGGASYLELSVVIGGFVTIYIASFNLISFNEEPRIKIATAFLLGILVFNPAGAINWYWPYMIEMVLALTFIFVAFIKASQGQMLIPIILLFLAMISEAIGLFGSLAISISFFIASVSSRSNLKVAIIWLAFFVGTFLVYTHNLATGVREFSITNIIHYALVFVGKVPYSLFYFPNRSMWGYPEFNYAEVILGILFLSIYSYIFIENIKNKPSTNVLLSNSLIVFVLIASALLAISRGAPAAEGVSHANTQPTYLLASFFYIGLFVLFIEVKQRLISKCICGLVITLVPFVFITRYESIEVFEQIIKFKHELEASYILSSENKGHTLVYPNDEVGYRFIARYCKSFPRCVDYSKF